MFLAHLITADDSGVFNMEAEPVGWAHRLKQEGLEK